MAWIKDFMQLLVTTDNPIFGRVHHLRYPLSILEWQIIELRYSSALMHEALLINEVLELEKLKFIWRFAN